MPSALAVSLVTFYIFLCGVNANDDIQKLERTILLRRQSELVNLRPLLMGSTFHLIEKSYNHESNVSNFLEQFLQNIRSDPVFDSHFWKITELSDNMLTLIASCKEVYLVRPYVKVDKNHPDCQHFDSKLQSFHSEVKALLHLIPIELANGDKKLPEEVSISFLAYFRQAESFETLTQIAFMSIQERQNYMKQLDTQLDEISARLQQIESNKSNISSKMDQLTQFVCTNPNDTQIKPCPATVVDSLQQLKRRQWHYLRLRLLIDVSSLPKVISNSFSEYIIKLIKSNSNESLAASHGELVIDDPKDWMRSIKNVPKDLQIVSNGDLSECTHFFSDLSVLSNDLKILSENEDYVPRVHIQAHKEKQFVTQSFVELGILHEEDLFDEKCEFLMFTQMVTEWTRLEQQFSENGAITSMTKQSYLSKTLQNILLDSWTELQNLTLELFPGNNPFFAFEEANTSFLSCIDFSMKMYTKQSEFLSPGMDSETAFLYDLLHERYLTTALSTLKNSAHFKNPFIGFIFKTNDRVVVANLCRTSLNAVLQARVLLNTLPTNKSDSLVSQYLQSWSRLALAYDSYTELLNYIFKLHKSDDSATVNWIHQHLDKMSQFRTEFSIPPADKFTFVPPDEDMKSDWIQVTIRKAHGLIEHFKTHHRKFDDYLGQMYWAWFDGVILNFFHFAELNTHLKDQVDVVIKERLQYYNKVKDSLLEQYVYGTISKSDVSIIDQLFKNLNTSILRASDSESHHLIVSSMINRSMDHIVGAQKLLNKKHRTSSLLATMNHVHFLEVEALKRGIEVELKPELFAIHELCTGVHITICWDIVSPNLTNLRKLEHELARSEFLLNANHLKDQTLQKLRQSILTSLIENNGTPYDRKNEVKQVQALGDLNELIESIHNIHTVLGQFEEVKGSEELIALVVAKAIELRVITKEETTIDKEKLIKTVSDLETKYMILIKNFQQSEISFVDDISSGEISTKPSDENADLNIALFDLDQLIIHRQKARNILRQVHESVRASRGQEVFFLRAQMGLLANEIVYDKYTGILGKIRKNLNVYVQRSRFLSELKTQKAELATSATFASFEEKVKKREREVRVKCEVTLTPLTESFGKKKFSHSLPQAVNHTYNLMQQCIKTNENDDCMKISSEHLFLYSLLWKQARADPEWSYVLHVCNIHTEIINQVFDSLINQKNFQVDNDFLSLQSLEKHIEHVRNEAYMTLGFSGARTTSPKWAVIIIIIASFIIICSFVTLIVLLKIMRNKKSMHTVFNSNLKQPNYSDHLAEEGLVEMQ